MTRTCEDFLFEEIPLILDNGHAAGMFTGSAIIVFEDERAAPFVAAIEVDGRKLDVGNWGEWAIYKMLTAGILKVCADRIEAVRAELFADELRAEAEQDEAERSPRLHGRV